MKGSRPAVDDGKEKRCCDAIMIGYNGPRTPDRLWSTYRNTPPARNSPFPIHCHRKVDDFDQSFATCPRKLTLCPLRPLPFPPPLLSPSSKRNERVVYRNEKRTNLFLIEISVPSNSIERNIDFQQSCLFPHGLSSKDSCNVIT